MNPPYLQDYKLSYTAEGEDGETAESGLLQTITRLPAESEEVLTHYEYDDLGRLLSERINNPTEEEGENEEIVRPHPKDANHPHPIALYEFAYDNAGNITSSSLEEGGEEPEVEAYKYNADNELCLEVAPAHIPAECPSEHDVYGRIPSYDLDGNLTSTSQAGAEFAYTARGQLKSTKPHGGSETQIVSHGTGQADLASIGSEEVIENVLGVGSTGSEGTAKYYTRASEGQLLAKRDAAGTPNATQYYLLDPLGSVAMLTNSTGAVTAPATGSYEYGPYGEPRGATPTTFGYRSAQSVPDGLLHFGERYYDPEQHRWTQQDPIEQITSLTQSDRYSYADDDPVNEVDLSGESIFTEAWEGITSVVSNGWNSVRNWLATHKSLLCKIVAGGSAVLAGGATAVVSGNWVIIGGVSYLVGEAALESCEH